MAVLILAKHDNAHLNDATAKTVTAAKAMGGDITVLVAGQDCAAVAEAAAKLDGVRKVIHVEGEAYGHRLAEPLTDARAWRWPGPTSTSSSRHHLAARTWPRGWRRCSTSW